MYLIMSQDRNIHKDYNIRKNEISHPFKFTSLKEKMWNYTYLINL